MKKLLSILLVSIFLFSLVACSSDSGKEIIVNYENVEKQKEPPTLNVMYGDNSVDPTITIDEKTRFIDIVNSTPTREGYEFAGWYSDSAFTDRIDPKAITKAQYSRGYAYAKWITVDTVSYNVRTDEASITDSGRENQTMDVVYLGSDFNFADLKNAGYGKVKITVKVDIAEIDDGYQYVFLYKDSNCASSSANSLMDLYDKYVFGEEEDDPSLLFGQQFDHYPEGTDTSPKTYSFDAVIDVTNLKDNLYIRYGASGKGGDTWKCSNVVVTVTPVK